MTALEIGNDYSGGRRQQRALGNIPGSTQNRPGITEAWVGRR